ncbi:MAG: RagB/SusD family nutrient uptake outer membrane protein, partial [Bacteroidales bacterium]|nr:RagB/SusD family nutrient uptake outer membrane protein [Bacteroidales bacterium]
DDFLNLQTTNSYTEDSYLTTTEQLQEAVAAAYYGFYHVGLFAREWYFYHDMLGNDAKAAPAIVGTGSMGQLPSLTYDGTNTEIQNLWRALYRIVLRSTIALDKSKDFEPGTATETQIKSDILGESSLLKAWSYFALYRFWGTVPLRRTIEDMAIKNYPRCETEQDMVDYILELLADAETNLRVDWDAANLGRATRGAAVALRGQLYMWEGEYALALAEFGKLRTSPYSYELAPDFAEICTEAGDNSVESIFEIQHANNPGTNVWYMFGGQESWGPDQAITGRAMEFGFNDWFNVFASNSLVEAFKYDIPSGTANYIDPRAQTTFYGDGTYGGDTDFWCDTCAGNVQPYPFPAKGYAFKKYQYYELREQEGQPQSEINTRYLRFADVLLQMAECELMANSDEAAAMALINEVRARSGAEEYTDLGADPMATLKHERRLELGGEQVRFWDMVRWGDLVTVLNNEKEAQGEGRPFQEKHRLFPIPTDELDINQEMSNDVYYPNWY